MMKPTEKTAEKNGKGETWEDPIVAEVRAVRDKIAARFDYDLDRIFDHVVAWGAERRKKGSRSAARSSKAKAK